MTEQRAPYVMPPTMQLFLAFTLSHDQDAAVKYFVERYGENPANIIRWKGNLYLGPAPEHSERESEK